MKHPANSPAGESRPTDPAAEDRPEALELLRTKAHYLETVNEFARSLMAEGSVDDILWSVVRNAIANLDFEDCVIYLLDDTGAQLVQRAAYGPKNPYERKIADPITIPVGEGVTGTAAATGQVQLVADCSKDARYIVDDEIRRSELAVPIMDGPKVLGVIDSEHSEAGFFTQVHADILRTIAAMAASRIVQASAMERMEAAERQTRETADRLLTVVESIDEGLIVFDAQGQVRLHNQAICDITGCSVAELADGSFEQLISTGMFESFFSDDPGSGDRPDVLNRELVHRRPDGSVRSLLVSGILVTEQDERLVLFTCRDVTAISEAMREIADVKVFYEQVLDRIPDRLQLAVFDSDLRYEYVSPSAIRSSQARRQIIGLTDVEWALSRGSDADRAGRRMQILRQARDGLEPESFSEDITDAEGTRRHYIRFVEPVLDADGNVLHLVGFGLDVSEEQEAKEALALSEERYRELVEGATEFIWQSESDGTFTYANPVALRALGLEADQVIGKSYLEFIAPAWRTEVREFYERQLSDERATTYLEFPVVRGDGSEMWLGQSVGLLRREGKVIGVQAVARDVTDKILAETRLKELEARKSAILATALDGIISIDSQSRIIDFNPTSEVMFGHKAVDVVGRDLSEVLIPPVYREAHKKGMVHYRETGEGPVLGRRIEISALRKDGTEFPIELAIQPIEVGDTQLFTAYVRDISEQKKAQEELDRAMDLARESVEAKERFLANMSHEMRTPLNAVIGFTHLLLESETTPQQQRYLDAVRYSADHLLVLINDLLDLARIESGKLQFERIPFRPEEVLESVAETFRPRVVEKGLTFTLEVDSSLPPWVLGDPVRLGQVLINLVANAIKFTDEGHVTVRGSGVLSSETASLTFEVEDSGVGISKEKTESIFEHFSQASDDTSRRYGGTGLGLAIVSELVTQQDGSVTVESEEGVGSLFRVHIDLPIPGEHEIQSHLREDRSVETVDLSGLSVLVVEDNEMNQYVATTMLGNWEVESVVAENGLVALDLLSAGTVYDCILMDIQMPEMDGYETVKRIRSGYGEYGRSVPIIALTASTLADSRDQVIEAGMDDFILKPFDPDDLRLAIAYHSGRTGQRPQLNQDHTMPVDLEFLSDRAGVSSEFTLRMLSIFERQTPILLDELRSALASEDGERIHGLAHKLKSSAAMLGLHEAAAALKSLEDITADKQFPSNGRESGRVALDACQRALAGVRQAISDLE